MPSAPLRNLAKGEIRSRKFLAGDYFVNSRRSATNRLAFGHAISNEESRAKTPSRKEECEGDDGDEEGIMGIQPMETGKTGRRGLRGRGEAK